MEFFVSYFTTLTILYDKERNYNNVMRKSSKIDSCQKNAL